MTGLYLIPFLYQTTTSIAFSPLLHLLYLILFLYQTTTYEHCQYHQHSCILFCSYIKPQRYLGCFLADQVVSYSVPISNHNPLVEKLFLSLVVSYSVPISNHNLSHDDFISVSLYLILFLYQTTTFRVNYALKGMLYLILFLYQTTTSVKHSSPYRRLYLILFLYQTTTCFFIHYSLLLLYLILFLYQTTTLSGIVIGWSGCILFCSYIKPQRW